MQKSKKHICQCFLHYYKLGYNASEAKRKMYQAIGENGMCINRSQYIVETTDWEILSLEMRSGVSILTV